MTDDQTTKELLAQALLVESNSLRRSTSLLSGTAQRGLAERLENVARQVQALQAVGEQDKVAFLTGSLHRRITAQARKLDDIRGIVDARGRDEPDDEIREVLDR